MRQGRNIYYLLILMLLTACGGNSKQKQIKLLPQISKDIFIDLDQPKIEKKAAWIDKIFKKLHKRNGFIGTVLYAEKGRLVYKNAFGLGDLRKKDSLKLNSAFQLASVSKMFAATSIMILKEDSLVDYDQDVRLFFPDFPYENVTIRHLLNHRSGLPRYMSLAHEYWNNKRIPISNEDMMKLFVKHKPNTYFKPDKGFHYCNTNYALLANIVEKVSGQHFDEFVKKNIFDPLEMDDSFIYNMRGDSLVSPYIKEGVPGYRYRGWRPIKQRNEYLNGVMGDKGVYLFKFDQALYDGKLLNDSTLAEAFKPGSPKSRRRRGNYGFGWRIKDHRENTVYHYGWWKGFRAFFIRDLAQEKTIIVLSNREKGPGSATFWRIIDNKDYELVSIRKMP